MLSRERLKSNLNEPNRAWPDRLDFVLLEYIYIYIYVMSDLY